MPEPALAEGFIPKHWRVLGADEAMDAAAGAAAPAPRASSSRRAVPVEGLRSGKGDPPAGTAAAAPSGECAVSSTAGKAAASLQAVSVLPAGTHTLSPCSAKGAPSPGCVRGGSAAPSGDPAATSCNLAGYRQPQTSAQTHRRRHSCCQRRCGKQVIKYLIYEVKARCQSRNKPLLDRLFLFGCLGWLFCCFLFGCFCFCQKV